MAFLPSSVASRMTRDSDRSSKTCICSAYTSAFFAAFGSSLSTVPFNFKMACTKTRNAKTKPSKRNDHNHQNDQTKITKPPKHNNKTTETSDKTF